MMKRWNDRRKMSGLFSTYVKLQLSFNQTKLDKEVLPKFYSCEIHFRVEKSLT